MALRDFYVSGSFAEKYAIIPADIREKAVQLKSLFFTECGVDSNERIGQLYNTMAIQMIPFLRPHELDKVWNALGAGACVPFFTTRDLQWIELFQAIGRRDAGTMATAAEALLEHERDLPKGPMSYLVASGMLGYLVQGDKEGSLRLWQKYRTALYAAGEQSVLFRLLESLSEKK
jgi:hypothetical protein